MFEILPVNEKNVLAFKATGKLTDADYQMFLPVLEEMIRRTGPVSLYIELQDFHGWEAQAAWDDFRFGIRHDHDFRRIAIVGDKSVVHAAVGLTNLFSNSEIKYFEQNDSDSAWGWLEEVTQESEIRSHSQAYKNILLPTDFSAYSDASAQRAIQIAMQSGARLQVLHIVEDLTYFSEDFDPLEIDFSLIKNTLMTQAEEKMHEFSRRNELDDDVEHKIKMGSPKRDILLWAGRNNSDLIVLGSKGLRGIGRLLGSVSSSVLHKAVCDVLIVKV